MLEYLKHKQKELGSPRERNIYSTKTTDRKTHYLDIERSYSGRAFLERVAVIQGGTPQPWSERKSDGGKLPPAEKDQGMSGDWLQQRDHLRSEWSPLQRDEGHSMPSTGDGAGT